MTTYRHIKIVKSSSELAKHNVSASTAGVHAFKSIDGAYVVARDGTRVEVEDSYISHYLDISTYIPRVLNVGVGDYVMFRSVHSLKFGEIGVVESITDQCIIVLCNGERHYVTRFDEEMSVYDNIVYIRSQFPICLANAILISDLEGLMLDGDVRMHATSSWTEKDKLYAQSHIVVAGQNSASSSPVPATPSCTPESYTRIAVQ